MSAFSNTSGGWVVFGMEQRGKRFFVEGVENGEKIETDFNSTVTYYRQYTSSENDGGSTTPVTTPKESIEDLILHFVRATPTISKSEMANLLGVKSSKVRYYIRKLNKKGRIEWIGNSKNGRWVFNVPDNAKMSATDDNNVRNNGELSAAEIENVRNNVFFGQLSNRQLAIISMIAQNSHVGVGQMAEMLGVNEKTIRREIKVLRENDIIERIGGSFGGEWIVLSSK